MNSTSEPSTTSMLEHSVLLSQELLLNLLHKIDAFPESPLPGDGDQRLSEITDGISGFVDLTTLTAHLIRKFLRRQLSEIKESHINLLFIMKAINSAHLKGDAMALSELIKYELRDNLTQWKIGLIPQTRRLLSGSQSISTRS